MQIIAVSLTLGQKAMTVQVHDAAGQPRRIAYQWLDVKEGPCHAPPDTWVSAVAGEVEFQRAEELAASRGMKTP